MTPDLDRQFWCAFDALLQESNTLRAQALLESNARRAQARRDGRRLPPPADKHEAAEALIHAATELQDRGAWMFVFTVFDYFIAADSAPPMPVLSAVNRILVGVRSGKTWDEAMGLQTRPGRRSAGLSGREWARTNASLVRHWHEDHGDNLEIACEKVAEIRRSMDEKSGKRRSRGDQNGISESKIKADYLAWKRGEI